MKKKRTCYWFDETAMTEKGVIPSVVTEGEPGHSPLTGNGEHARPWYWGPDYASAYAQCKQANEELGLTEGDVLEIVSSSMFASVPVAGASNGEAATSPVPTARVERTDIERIPEVEDWTRQDADGRPYLAFFDRDTSLAFCWAGDPEQPVEVSHGGMGEPVIATFTVGPEQTELFSILSADHHTPFPQSFLKAFRYVCYSWLENDYEGAPS